MKLFNYFHLQEAANKKSENGFSQKHIKNNDLFLKHEDFTILSLYFFLNNTFIFVNVVD